MKKYLIENWRKMIPFAIVGGVFNLIELGGSYYLIEYHDVNLWIGYSLCFLLATIVGYTLNTFYTYKSKFNWSNFLIYFSIYMGALLLGNIVMFLLKNITDFKDSIYPFLAAPTVYIWNFFMTNKFLKR